MSNQEASSGSRSLKGIISWIVAIAVVLIIINIAIGNLTFAIGCGVLFILFIFLISCCVKLSKPSTSAPTSQPRPPPTQFRQPTTTYTPDGQPIYTYPTASNPPFHPSGRGSGHNSGRPTTFQQLDARVLTMPSSGAMPQFYQFGVSDRPPEYSTLNPSAGASVGFVVPSEAPPVADKNKVFQPSADGLPSYEVALATTRVGVDDSSSALVTRRSNSQQDASHL